LDGRRWTELGKFAGALHEGPAQAASLRLTLDPSGLTPMSPSPPSIDRALCSHNSGLPCALD
jgi:hypothetical protein